MYWRFDINKFALHQLPLLLRNPVIYALLKCLMIAFNAVYDSFVAHRKAVMRQLDYNGFTISLERYLNSVFGLENAIFITEYRSDNVYLSYIEEGYPKVYVGYKNEGDTIFLSSVSPDTLRGGFIVNIPERLATEENIAIIRKWVDYYRMAGTLFILKSYE